MIAKAPNRDNKAQIRLASIGDLILSNALSGVGSLAVLHGNPLHVTVMFMVMPPTVIVWRVLRVAILHTAFPMPPATMVGKGWCGRHKIKRHANQKPKQ